MLLYYVICLSSHLLEQNLLFIEGGLKKGYIYQIVFSFKDLLTGFVRMVWMKDVVSLSSN